MKYYSLAILAVAFVLLSAQSDGGKKVRAKFTVYGNCGMCESKIEGALENVEGIAWADWDVETYDMVVKFDPSVISLDQIKQRIADVGYDSDSHRASQEVYDQLHACCKYERPKKKK